MTDEVLVVPEAEQVGVVESVGLSKTQLRKRKRYITPFQANIQLYSAIKLLNEDEVQVAWNGLPMVFPIALSQREKIKSNPPEEGKIYSIQLWFRTSEGVATDLMFGSFSVIKDKNPDEITRYAAQDFLLFRIGGRIEVIDKEEGEITFTIEPNKIGSLDEAFSVEAWIALDLMNSLQRVGRTMMVEGEYRPGSGRLVVKRVFPTLIGNPPERPKRPKKPKAEKKAKKAKEELEPEPEAKAEQVRD